MKNTTARNVTTYWSALTLIALLLLFLAISQSLTAQTSYTITDIGPLNDLFDDVPGAAGVNNNGIVVGQAFLAAGPDRPFLWINGSLFDLGTFGGPNGGARGVNSRGEIVGQADTAAAQEQKHAFVWTNGVLHDLGTLGGDSSVGNSINNHGWIAGAADTAMPDPTGTIGPNQNHAFLRILDGALQDLGTLGGPNSHAISINDNAVIVGWSQIDFVIGTFGIPDLHPAVWVKGMPTRLPDLGGSVSLATSVNDNGTAVGQSLLADDSAFYAVMWQNGQLSNLGAVGDDVLSSASSINNREDVVGFSITPSFVSRAFRWQKGAMIDLNTLIPANSGWVLLGAAHIDDAGQIVGNGLLNGNLHAFLLSPNRGGSSAGGGAPASLPLSPAMIQSLVWGRTGLLRHNSTR